jgi:hypothetical protein
MSRRYLRGLTVFAVLLFAFVFVRQHFVLNSGFLSEAIKREIPEGSSKAQVISFVQLRHPVTFDDLGSQVKARFSGVAENLVYRKDIVLTFDFSPDGRLLSVASKEYLTFL